jgi:hypothetical protein
MTSNPYAAPRAVIATGPELALARRRVALAFAWFGASVAAFAGALMVTSAGSRPLGTSVLAAATLVGVVGTWRAVRATTSAYKVPGPRAGRWLVASGVIAALLNLGMVAIGALATLLSTVTFSRGRQLRRFGRVLLPPVARGGEWARQEARIDVHDADRAGVAARWRENGRTEHASVAAFARLTLDLMALGAPPSLVGSAQRDALDEIAHAEACFAIARAVDGCVASPAAFPQAARARTLPRVRRVALALLAVDSLVDGALHEGTSARVVARLARVCEEPTIAAALKKIAADEGRHSAHGWDVVEWCVAQGGAIVLSALEGALLALPATLRTPLPEPAASGAWEKWGIHGHAIESEEYSKAYDHVVRRVRALREGSLAAA